jgi:prolyl oligopeptidase
LPKVPVQVKRIPSFTAKDNTAAYYFPPSFDGKRPGTYYVNTYAPRSRPRYTAEVLAFHEAVPGHHLQLGIANELTGLPDFRKYGGTTAFIEGWGLYSEQVSQDLGLYSDDLSVMGKLSFEAWRAARLVVDSGMHGLGWDRAKALAYLYDNTALSKLDAENEINRYITWPGQALAYKVGQLEILSLRKEAQDRLGSKFDLRQFHDRVLENGSVTLPVLRAQVEDWLANP